MNPIDIRYHVISLVAVFLALGVGILVGSNTNFFNIQTIIDQQGSLIKKLEATHKDLRKQIDMDRTRQKESDAYITGLEQKTIPALITGRLRGMNVGLVAVGDFSKESIEENPAVDTLAKTGCSISYQMKLSLESLQKIAAARKDNVPDLLASELTEGAAHSSDITSLLQADGSVVSGDFQKPVQAVVFILGKDIDVKLGAGVLLPLQAAAQSKSVAVVSVVNEKNDGYRKMLSGQKAQMPVIQEIGNITAQVDFTNLLAKQFDPIRDAILQKAAEGQQPQPAQPVQPAATGRRHR